MKYRYINITTWILCSCHTNISEKSRTRQQTILNYTILKTICTNQSLKATKDARSNPVPRDILEREATVPNLLYVYTLKKEQYS